MGSRGASGEVGVGRGSTTDASTARSRPASVDEEAVTYQRVKR